MLGQRKGEENQDPTEGGDRAGTIGTTPVYTSTLAKGFILESKGSVFAVET